MEWRTSFAWRRRRSSTTSASAISRRLGTCSECPCTRSSTRTSFRTATGSFARYSTFSASNGTTTYSITKRPRLAAVTSRRPATPRSWSPSTRGRPAAGRTIASTSSRSFPCFDPGSRSSDTRSDAMSVDALLQDAERALGAGNLEGAAELLERAAAQRPDDLSLWLRLAGIQRGMGRPRVALNSVHRALTVSPRDFSALLMRASLLDRLGDAEAPAAWGNALANKPAGDLPPQLATVVAQGEKRHEDWLATRDAAMKARMAVCEDRAGPEERTRIERFRSNVLRRTQPYHSNP